MCIKGKWLKLEWDKNEMKPVIISSHYYLVFYDQFQLIAFWGFVAKKRDPISKTPLSAPYFPHVFKWYLFPSMSQSVAELMTIINLSLLFLELFVLSGSLDVLPASYLDYFRATITTRYQSCSVQPESPVLCVEGGLSCIRPKSRSTRCANGIT